MGLEKEAIASTLSDKKGGEYILDSLLNIGEVARLIRRHPTTVARYAEIHRVDPRFGLPGLRIGRGWKFRIRDIEKVLKAGIELPRKKGRPRKAG
jgi:hypothetical protein